MAIGSLGGVMAALVAGPLPASAQAPNAAGSIGLRLVDAPVSARDDPRAQVYIVDHLAPGAAIQRRIEVSNSTDSAAQVALYASAAAITDGSFLGAAGQTVNDLVTWTSVSPGALEVPADGRTMATVAITVPADAAPGEQYGVVWAEVRSAPRAGGGVVQVSRVGIRLYLSVGPGGAPAPQFTIDALTAERSPEGRPRVVASVHNTGGRALDMNGTLLLSGGPGGLTAGPFPVTLGTTLAIGATAPVSIALDERLPAGPWEARLTLRSGLVERSAVAMLTFPEAGAAAPVAVTTPSSQSWLLPALGFLVVLFLLVGVGGLLAVLRRGRQPGPPVPLA